jgi:hypothetical protein
MTQNPPAQPPTITLEWVEQQEAFHKKKLASLAVIKAALLDLVTPEANVGHEPPPAKNFTVRFPPKPVAAATNTKKIIILRAIASSAVGLNTQEIVSACINAGIDGTNQSNTSPQLSLYKAQGNLRLVENRWVITDKGRALLADTFKN